MISLWSLLFASVMQPAEAVDDGLLGQAAKPDRDMKFESAGFPGRASWQ
jgi:hypothetical protein